MITYDLTEQKGHRPYCGDIYFVYWDESGTNERRCEVHRLQGNAECAPYGKACGPNRGTVIISKNPPIAAGYPCPDIIGIDGRTIEAPIMDEGAAA